MDRRSWWFDATIAAGVIIVGQLDGWLGVTATHRQGPHWAEALLYAIGGALLLWRRARPLAVLSAIVAAAVVEFATFGSPEGFGVEMPALIAAYTVARWEQRRSTWWALPLLGVYGAAWILLDPLQITATQRFGGLFWVSQLFIGWLIGALVRGRLRTLEQRRLRRAEHQQRAIAEERTRIARELHDVIGHSVSVMTLQAAAVRRRLTPSRPPNARRSNRWRPWDARR
ncbi:histidine kinase [Raineyella fluvialis]|nr:histidine kinase [Raineyella fluvialis]